MAVCNGLCLSPSGATRVALLVAFVVFACMKSEGASAGTIRINGYQVWDNEPRGDGGYYINGHTLFFFEFDMLAPSSVLFEVTPAPPGVDAPRANVYQGRLGEEFPYVGGGRLPFSLDLEPGLHTIAFSYGFFNSDNVTEDQYVFERGGTLPYFPDLRFRLSLTGDGLAIPEPGTILLLLSALAGLWLRRGGGIRVSSSGDRPDALQRQ